MFLEAVGFVAGLEPGFKGSGGGARSGSELSHLKAAKLTVSLAQKSSLERDAYIGTEARPESEAEE